MTNLTIYNGNNGQEIKLNGLVDDDGSPVITATITGKLVRGSAELTGSDIAFLPTDSAGDYKGMLNGFDAPAGPAQLQVTGSNAGVNFSFSVFVTIAGRSL